MVGVEKIADIAKDFAFPVLLTPFKADITAELLDLLELDQGISTISSKVARFPPIEWKSADGTNLIKSEFILVTIYQVDGNHCRCSHSSSWSSMDYHSHINDGRGYRPNFAIRDSRGQPMFEWVPGELGDIACRQYYRPLPFPSGVEVSEVFQFPFDDVTFVNAGCSGKFGQCHF